MKAKTQNKNRSNFLYPDLMNQPNPDHPLLQLAKQIPWQRFEGEFSGYYSEMGRPAKPIRLSLTWYHVADDNDFFRLDCPAMIPMILCYDYYPTTPVMVDHYGYFSRHFYVCDF